ncbi:TonB-dependent receptor [Sphingobium estronivorans]|uniref:TonB-dependent receptor n=1 Tax=Sphingobium estronivorans TaxID=1577690 RepID=UPI001238FFFA|nr:TonB-dependent receptor [Sphingobium estronivorans]
MKFRHVSLTAIAIGILPATAHAEDAEPYKARMIVVTAARQAKTARDEQLIAPNIVNIQSAETIAKYPDVNAAEALSRLPGVSLSIDTAEGRFVNIRGLDGNLNGATFGGVNLLNTQPGGTYFNASGRAVEFDTIPVGAVDRITVTKTGLPDHDAEGIGGSVELTPRTAIGTKEPFADITLGGGIETFKGKGLYRDEVVLGGAFGGVNANGDKPFSVVFTQYLHNDHRSFDDIEAAYIDDSTVAPDKAFAALELRKYDYYRQRFGYSGEFDFTPNADQRFYLRASLAGYNEHVSRNRLELDFNGTTVVDPANANGFASTGVNALKTLRDEDETHRNLVIQLGGDNHFGLAHVEYWGAYSRATYDKHYDYNSEFDNPANYGLTYDNSTNPNYPRFAVTSGTGLTDPANYFLVNVKNSAEKDRDEEWSYAASVAIPLGLAAGDEFKVGGKLRYREKVADPVNGRFDYAGLPLALTGFAQGPAVTNFYHAGYDIGPVTDGSGLRSLFDQSGSALKRNIGGYFDDSEDITAVFAQYKGSFGPLGLLVGLRYEHSSATYRGIGSTTDIQGNTVTTPIATGRSYDNWFPTAQLRYAFSPELIARATYSTGLARPGFYQAQQATNIDLGGLTVSTGNPTLLPTYSHNFDVSLEYYLPNAGILSVGAFDKEMLDYIVTRTQLVSGYAGNAGIFNVATYENARHAHARGVEANYVNHFRGLPGLLSGFGIDANATYVDSAVALRDGEGQVALPGTFKWSWNAAVFYELGAVKIRLASQYESSVLFGVGGSRATDIFQDSRYTLDFNGSYTVNRNVEVYFNAKNLTNAPLRFYEGTPNRPIQREFYDVTLEGGVKLHF